MEAWLAKFLADEKRTAVWSHCLPDGFPTWAYFRGRAALQRYRRARVIIEPLHAQTTLRQHLQGMLREHARSLLVLPWQRRAAFDALFFTDVNLASDPFGGEDAIDRIHEGYFQLCANPLILQSAYGGRFNRYRRWRRNIYCATSWMVFVRRLFEWPALARGSQPGDDAAAAALAKMFEGRMSAQSLLGEMRRMRGALRFFEHWVGRVLTPRMARRVAFVTFACGLGHNALLTHVLHLQGYLVLEAQHGVINENVFSYQYPALDSPEALRRVLPDLLLTFGSAVQEAVSPSIPCRTVGNYYLCQLAEKIRQAPANDAGGDEILVLSQGGASRQMSEIAAALGESFPEKRIILKLHPSEHVGRDLLQHVASRPNVRVTRPESVYNLMARVPVIVGYFSLALLEAAAFPQKRIFMLKNEYLPRGLGYEFVDIPDLIEAVKDPARGVPTLCVDDYWSCRWQERSAALRAELETRLARGQVT